MATNQQATNRSDNKPIKHSKIIGKIFKCTNDHLLLLINHMLDTADKKLFDLAERANSDENQMKYMDCTRIFRTEKNDISSRFFINLNNSLAINKNSVSETDDQQLSLVGQDEMEEMVAITTMHAKAMNIYGEEVMNFETRLEYLEINCKNMFDKEALDPKHICEVFQKTIENIEIAIDVKLVFYKLFDQEVCSKLEVMYKTINKMLIENGIMPEIILKTTKNEDVEQGHIEDEVSPRVANYYDPTEKVETNFIPRSNNEVSHIVNEFMSGEMTISENDIELPASFIRVPTQQDLDGKNCYERKEVLKALSTLQHKLTSLQTETECLSSEQIKQELVADISRSNGGNVTKQVNLLDERSIDFVGMMFGAIADDKTVSELMTSLIYQLQIPVMKVAMSDRTLFDEDEHPARATVDLLTFAGKGINNDKDNLYNELETVVDEILNEFDIDIKAFEKAVDELQEIIQKEQSITDETERNQQRKVLQEHAQHIVISQLKMVSCNKKIPNEIRPLVLKHWSTLMLNRYIRHGRDSEQWMQSVLLLKLLLKCMQPIKYQSQLDLVETNHMALIEAVNDELYETQQDKSDIKNQIVSLKKHFLQMIESYNLTLIDENNGTINETISENSIITEEIETENSEETLQQIQQQIETAKQKIAQLSSSTKPGVWYEIYNGEDKAIRRLKLSVILTDAAQLIFVNRKGIKVIEKDAAVFAKELEEDRSRLIADHSTFDHALGQVMNAFAA
ncbi:hypothetical protein MNBD_GAMMA06-1528 [hydrothermal vent metagenome]|uniref:Thymidine phosphorylase n=1 Tax=hydrothermal vent metagenome TaxID=652676 RepID=A0A3B0WME6_9ZZZZ